MSETNTTLKTEIQNFLDLKYKGTFRFLKVGMFRDNFGDTNLDKVIKNTDFLKDTIYDTFSIRVRSYLMNLSAIPKCYCGNDVKFHSNKGWLVFCSAKCSANSNQTQQKREDTNITKYGTGNVFASNEIKEKIKDTFIQKYGVDNYAKSDEYKERLANGDIQRNQDYSKSGLSRKIANYHRLDDKFKQIRKNFTLEEYLEHGSYTYHKYEWLCLKCNDKFKWWLNFGYTPECSKCRPRGTSLERTIMEFLIKNKVEYIPRDRSTIEGNLEIDILIPSKKIGIEINGLRYHSEANPNYTKMYHLAKTLAAKDKGVKLLHIMGDELHYKENIVKSKLKHILGLVKRKVYARKCEVSVITPSEKHNFFNKYHIQGDSMGSIHLGLKYKGRLVAAMEFCRPRIGIGSNLEPDDTYELMRYATINGFNIIGGAGKLLSYFKNNYKWAKIFSYADCRWSTGDMYEKLGFSRENKTVVPNYYYTRTFYDKYHRVGFRKNDRALKFGEKHNPNLKEHEDMKNNGYYRVWDCGTLKYSMNK